MTNMELVLNMLAEATTTEISKSREPNNTVANRQVALEGGTVAGNARKEIEEKTGKKIVSDKNFKRLPKAAQTKKLKKLG